MITVRLQFLAILLLLGVICSGMLEIQKVDGELRASQATVVQLTTILVKVRHTATGCTSEDAVKWWADTTSLSTARQKLCGKQQQPKHNHQHL